MILKAMGLIDMVAAFLIAMMPGIPTWLKLIVCIKLAYTASMSFIGGK